MGFIFKFLPKFYPVDDHFLIRKDTSLVEYANY